MLKKLMLFMLPLLMLFGFVRTIFGNQDFLMDWDDVITETAKMPDIPQMYEDDLNRIVEVWDEMLEHETFTQKLWSPNEENQEEQPEGFWEVVWQGIQYIGKAIAGIFTMLLDMFVYLGYLVWLIANVIYLVFDTLIIPIRFLVWIFNSYILPPTTA